MVQIPAGWVCKSTHPQLPHDPPVETATSVFSLLRCFLNQGGCGQVREGERRKRGRLQKCRLQLVLHMNTWVVMMLACYWRWALPAAKVIS